MIDEIANKDFKIKAEIPPKICQSGTILNLTVYSL